MKSVIAFSRIFFTGILVVMFTSACAGGAGVDPQSAWKEIRSGAKLIDVRTPEEFASGHLKGAVNIPYDQISSRLAEVGNDKGQPVVVYCRSGKRSAKAKDTLEGLGYNRVVNGGGYEAMKGTQ